MTEIIEYENILGLFYIEDVITDHDLLNKIDVEENWKPITTSQNSRLVKHYGYEYNYKVTNLNRRIPDIPEYLLPLKQSLVDYCKELFDKDIDFNQCIINNYYTGQSISKHIDSKVFGDIIGCYSIGDGIMRFSLDNVKHDLHIKSNSLYIMSGDSRYKWSHEMLKNKHSRRVSITFRTVI
jgi:alkylated DNA repair dioxygenase AlkB